jgi:hypothetical protein
VIEFILLPTFSGQHSSQCQLFRFSKWEKNVSFALLSAYSPQIPVVNPNVTTNVFISLLRLTFALHHVWILFSHFSGSTKSLEMKLYEREWKAIFTDVTFILHVLCILASSFKRLSLFTTFSLCYARSWLIVVHSLSILHSLIYQFHII